MKASSIIGGGPKEKRQGADFYPTPREVTEVLLRLEEGPIRHKKVVWDPACGDGALGKVFKEGDFNVVGSDLWDRGWGYAYRDFLKDDPSYCMEEKMEDVALVTNPPFSLAEEFIWRARELGVDYMALLLKSTFWHAKKRKKVWDEWMPRFIYPLLWRPDFMGGGAPTMDMMWCVWDGETDRCIYQPVGKE